MIDYFALGLTHFLLLLALIRIAGRAALDREPELEAEYKRGRRNRQSDRVESGKNDSASALTDGNRESRDD